MTSFVAKVQFKPIKELRETLIKLSQPKTILEVKQVPKTKPKKPNIVQSAQYL